MNGQRRRPILRGDILMATLLVDGVMMVGLTKAIADIAISVAPLIAFIS